jgi:hypothetical protein
MRPLMICAVALAVSGVSPTTAQTITTTIERRAPMQLTPQQRTIIYQSVTRDPRPAPRTEVQIVTGARVPSGIELSTLPENLYVEVPTVKRYKYVYVQNQVVLVDPDTGEVVEVINR